MYALIHPYDEAKILLRNYESLTDSNDRRRVPMIKTALFLCIAAAYVCVTFGMSIILGAFIRYYENA